MGYESEFTPLFLKLLARLDKLIRERILRAIEEIPKDPRRGSLLLFTREVCFKWRVGDYRIIYKIDERRRILIFIVVDHRARVYKRYKG